MKRWAHTDGATTSPGLWRFIEATIPILERVQKRDNRLHPLLLVIEANAVQLCFAILRQMETANLGEEREVK